MPAPRGEESRENFISRCIPQVMNEEGVEDREQAAAICFQYWRDAKGKNRANAQESIYIRPVVDSPKK